MSGNFVMYGVNALTYIALNKAQKHVPYGELVCTTDCIIL